jgi:hypothetical protein
MIIDPGSAKDLARYGLMDGTLTGILVLYGVSGARA